MNATDEIRLECRSCGRLCSALFSGQCRRCYDSRVAVFSAAMILIAVVLSCALIYGDEKKFQMEPAFTSAIRVYSCPNCPACDALKTDAQNPDFPAKIEHFPAPGWVKSFPTLHWQGANGRWYQHVGWRGRAQFLADFSPTRPHPTSEVLAPSQALPFVGQFREFAGDSGSFQFTPTAQISADLGDGAAISYRKIAGKYAVSGDQITVTFDQPGPHVDARKFGFHLGATVLGADYPEGGDPKMLGVATTVKKFRIRLEEVP